MRPEYKLPRPIFSMESRIELVQGVSCLMVHRASLLNGSSNQKEYDVEASGRAPAIPRPTLGLRGRASYRIMSRQVWEGNDPTVNSSKASQGLCLENSNATYSTDSYSSFRA